MRGLAAPLLTGDGPVQCLEAQRGSNARTFAPKELPLYLARPAALGGLGFGVVALFGSVTAHAAGVLAIGAEKGDSPRVVLRSNPVTTDIFPEIVAASFFAFDENFKGGVRVAVGDFDADPELELVTASGGGMSGTVKIWDLTANFNVDSLKESFSSPFAGLSGGLFVAAGDFDNDGKDSLVVSNGGSGEPRCWIFDDTETVNPTDGLLGNSLVDTFLAFPKAFNSGIRIAMGITNPDSKEDLVCLNGSGNSTHRIRIFRDNDNDSMLSDETLLDDFVPSINGPYKGMFAAVGNVGGGTQNGEIIVYITGGGNSTVRVFGDTDNDGIFSEHAVFETISSLTGGESKGGLRLCCANLDGDLGATARFELVASFKVPKGVPQLRLAESTSAQIGGATPQIVPYVDSLITTYFTKTPFVAWSD